MKILRKLKALMMILVLLLGVLAVPNGGVTVEAASKKVTVKKVTLVDSLTGSRMIYLAKGKKATLKTTVSVTPDKSANKKVTYKSSNKKVATVSGKGVITGKTAGTAKITVTSKKNSKKKATVTVKVVKGKVTGIQLNETSGTLIVGDSVKLTATVKTSKGGKKNVVWSSSDTKVATVKGGTVKAVGAGDSKITVTAADGSGKKATYKVTVKNKEESTTEKQTTENPTTEDTITEEPKVVLTNTEGKNASDVAVLQKIIKEQNQLGASVSTDLGTHVTGSEEDGEYYYGWNENGRLTGIFWAGCNLQGTLSFEGLTALTVLNCRGNQLSSLDVSRNTALTYLDCRGNQLSSLDVSRNTALTYLDCTRNQLSSLDVSGNMSLMRLTCSGNQLSSLDVSRNTALTSLVCIGNQLSSLDVSGNTALTRLNCNGNQLSSLDVSRNTALTYLDCTGNQLSSLDVSRNTALTYLDCTGNQLSSLDVTNCTQMEELYYDTDKVTLIGYSH